MAATSTPGGSSTGTMSTPTPEPRRLPSSRELARIAAAAAALIAVMTLVLGIDLSPGIDLQVGDLAQTDVRAPRALSDSNCARAWVD